MDNKSKITALFLIMSAVAFLLTPYPYEIYPQDVMNTYTAIEWCEISEEHASEYEYPTNIVDGATAHACIDHYRTYHNLTDDEFPTYIWLSYETPPVTTKYSLWVLVKIITMLMLGYYLINKIDRMYGIWKKKTKNK